MEIDTCRICLNEGAIYPIFESNEEFDCLYSKLAVCIRDKIENITGYPSNICLECKNTSDNINEFISKFEKANEILKSKIAIIKTEIESISDDNDNGTESELFHYELEIFKDAKVPKNNYKDPSEILQSLSHLTVKRIKLENDLDNHEIVDIENLVKKEKRPLRKTRSATKTACSKPAQNKLNKKQSGKNKSAPKPTVKKNAAVETSKTTYKCKPITLEEENKINNTHKQEKEENETRKLLCDYCGASFTELHNLKIHIVNQHLEKKFKCSKCPREFTRGCDLKEHRKRHENIRDHVCNLCGKAFFSNKVLKSHIRYTHDKIRKKFIYKCQFCDKSYTYKRGIIVHERSVHTGERPDVCHICGGSFFDSVYLKEHMRIHTGEAPFKCPVCGRGYAQRGNMKSHMRNHKISELHPDTLAKIKPNYIKFMRP